MPSLKDLKNRISSVKSTQKITSAMKMVAASKLRRAQEQVEASRPYADRMDRMLAAIAATFTAETEVPRMIGGTGREDTFLFLVMTSDRGLCGGFNSSIAREARRQISALLDEGKEVKIICVGRKGRDQLKQDFGARIITGYDDIGRQRSMYAEAERITQQILQMYDEDEIDVCRVFYNRFKSVISQVVTIQQLLPVVALRPPGDAAEGAATGPGGVADGTAGTEADLRAKFGEGREADDLPLMPYDFEPDQEEVLDELLPHNLTYQVYRALLESVASEQGARMSAMDNATRNAGDMIGRLTLQYNRTRQAAITKELIEIISGAEAL